MGGIQGALLNVAITAALPFAVDMIKNMLARDHINLYGDKVFDFCEDFFLGASIKVDDKFALPFLFNMREILAIPDLDENADRVLEAASPFVTETLSKVFSGECWGGPQGNVIRRLLADSSWNSLSIPGRCFPGRAEAPFMGFQDLILSIKASTRVLSCSTSSML